MITKIYDTHREFKDAYQLHQLRFAIIPWVKSSGEKVFQRHANKQYISEISTEDKNVKKHYDSILIFFILFLLFRPKFGELKYKVFFNHLLIKLYCTTMKT